MWRNLKFLHMWSNFKFIHMTEVEKSLISLHMAYVWCGEYIKLMLFCCKIGFVPIYAVCRKICFVMIHALLCGKNCICRVKMTNMRYASNSKMFQKSDIFVRNYFTPPFGELTFCFSDSSPLSLLFEKHPSILSSTPSFNRDRANPPRMQNQRKPGSDFLIQICQWKMMAEVGAPENKVDSTALQRGCSNIGNTCGFNTLCLKHSCVYLWYMSNIGKNKRTDSCILEVDYYISDHHPHIIITITRHCSVQSLSPSS